MALFYARCAEICPFGSMDVAAVIRDGDRIFATARGYGEYKGWWRSPS